MAVISAVLGSTGDSKSDPSGNDHKKTENQIMESEQTSAVPETEEVKAGDSNAGNAPEENEPEEDAADADPSLTMGQKNALAKAELYLNIGGFSHDGLIKQLEFEGFTNEEAVFAADNCGADWNEEAAKKAQQYLNVSSFSRSGLMDQLKFEGFTEEQAEYGVTAVGY